MDSKKSRAKSGGRKSTSKIINNIHSMPWLKHDSTSQNGNVQRASDKDGKILSAKKTDEDYFSGTREEKKVKKRKDKKVKSLLTIDNLANFINFNNEDAEPVAEIKETSKAPPEVENEAERSSETNLTTTTGTVWSTDTSIADKLFPGVQSVVIDRFEEEEMITRAIAESIATVQLEQFNKPSPEKGNRWEALYGDKDDDSGWDNVRRNLPSELETINTEKDAVSRRKGSDDNNNSPKSGILRNRQKSLSLLSVELNSLDFCFKKRSESLEEGIKSPRSLKSVSFDNSVAVKVASNESSDNEESQKILNTDTKEPNIDKFGRVDGYSERRLFMGKGARMKEQEYIKNKCSLDAGDGKQQILDSSPPATAIVETLKPLLISSQCPKNLQTQKSIPKLMELKTEMGEAVESFAKTAKTQKYTKPVVTVKKPDESVVKSTAVKPSSQSLSSSQSSTIDTLSEPKVTKTAGVKAKKNETEGFKVTKNVETSHNKSCHTLKAAASKVEHFVDRKSELASSSEKKIDSKNEEVENRSSDEIEIPSQRVEIIGKKDTKDLPRNIQSQAKISGEIPTRQMAALTTVDNLSHWQSSEETGDFVGQCLVPTLVRENESALSFPATNFLFTDLVETAPNLDFKSAAYQNLLLTGMSVSDANYDAQNSQHQNYYSRNSVPLVNVPLQTQSFNSVRHIQSEYIRSGNQAYQNTPITQLPNYDAYSLLPNYLNEANKVQMPYLAHCLGVEDIPYQNVGGLMNPRCNVSNFMERGENSESVRDYNELPPCARTESEKGPFFTPQAPPGLIKNLQLPPGFAKQEYDRKTNTDESDRANNSSGVTQSVRFTEHRREKIHSKESPSRNINNCPEKTSKRYPRSPKHSFAQNAQHRIHRQKSSVPASHSPPRKQQNYYKSQSTGSECQSSKTTEKRKAPYPILGAIQNPHENPSDCKSDNKFSSGKSSEFREEVVDNQWSRQNTFKTKTGETSVGLSSDDNNLPSSFPNETLQFDREGMNDSPRNFNPTPVICPIPGRQFEGSSKVTNWQYNLNFISPTQVPMNYVPNYQIPIPNHPNFPLNFPPDSFESPMYQNQGFHQSPPPHVFSQVQIPGYSVPHLLNVDGNGVQNMRANNIASQEMHPMLNYDTSVKMLHAGLPRTETQQSIVGAHSCADYNLNQIPAGQFVPNFSGCSNFYKTQMTPNAQDPWNWQHNPSDHFYEGKGPGILTKNDQS